MEEINAAACVRGRVRPFRVFFPLSMQYWPDKTTWFEPGVSLPGIWRPTAGWCHNDVLYGWGAAVARMLTQVGANYRISGMYLEYQNVADPGDTVEPPSFDRSGGISYYESLSSSPNVDYLRVPLIATTLGNSDPSLFSDVNQMSFYAMSQGIAGVNGKMFSDSVNSLVYGGALVATPVLGDPTQDVVFSRFYFQPSSQQLKLATSQIGLNWGLTLN